MKIPETAQKQTEDIAIGSGYMYIKEYEKGSAIPKISEIAVEDNRKGYFPAVRLFIIRLPLIHIRTIWKKYKKDFIW